MARRLDVFFNYWDDPFCSVFICAVFLLIGTLIANGCTILILIVNPKVNAGYCRQDPKVYGVWTPSRMGKSGAGSHEKNEPPHSPVSTRET